MTDGDRPTRPDELLARLLCIEPPSELDHLVLTRASVVLEEHAARRRVLGARAPRQRALEQDAGGTAKRKLVTRVSF